MNSSFFQISLISKSTGSATPIINRSKWEEILIPLPPAFEQIRINKKVHELFALCDALKEKIVQSQQIKVQLADVVAENAIN